MLHLQLHYPRCSHKQGQALRLRRTRISRFTSSPIPKPQGGLALPRSYELVYRPTATARDVLHSGASDFGILMDCSAQLSVQKLPPSATALRCRGLWNGQIRLYSRAERDTNNRRAWPGVAAKRLTCSSARPLQFRPRAMVLRIAPSV